MTVEQVKGWYFSKKAASETFKDYYERACRSGADWHQPLMMYQSTLREAKKYAAMYLEMTGTPVEG